MHTGPKDFAVGVKMGTVSLLSNVTGGVLDTAAKFTGSIGKGLAQASMDKKYQAQREGTWTPRPTNTHPRMQRRRLIPLVCACPDMNAAARLANKRKNKNAFRGAQAGLTSMAHGFTSGIVGVVEKPMQGGTCPIPRMPHMGPRRS